MLELRNAELQVVDGLPRRHAELGRDASRGAARAFADPARFPTPALENLSNGGTNLAALGA